jgi:hypothetical protein
MEIENAVWAILGAFFLGVLIALGFYDGVSKYHTPFGINELIKREVVQYNKTSGKLEWVEKDTVKITIDND